VRHTRLVGLVICIGCGGGGGQTPPDVPDVPIDAPIDGPVIPSDEAPDCGGDPLLAHQGDLSLVVSAMRIEALDASFDLDGDGVPDNKMSAISSLAQSTISDGLTMGTYAVPIEIFDRGPDPDTCVKLAMYRGTCVGTCNFTDATQDTVTLDPTTIDAGGVPISRLRSMSTTASGALSAGLGFLVVRVPVTTDLELELPVLVQRVEGTLAANGLTAMKFGGTVQAFRLDAIPAPPNAQIGVMPGDTLLDEFFANLLGPLLALPKSSLVTGCRTADIDIDGDGLEAFCDSNPNDDIKRVDLCVDGDGTIIHDGDNGVARCVDAMVGGVRRFPDGISTAFTLDARPATISP
jgi:hypothetical protein